MTRINLRKFIAEHYKGVTARYSRGHHQFIHAGANEISVDLFFPIGSKSLLLK